MRKITGFFLIFCFNFVFCLSVNAQIPIELRPKFTMKHCDTSNLNRNTICLDGEYLMDEIELVVGDSIYGRLPNRIDQFQSVRRAIGDGVMDEYEFYSDRFIKKMGLGVNDIQLLNEVGLDKIARIKFKNINTEEMLGKWLAVFAQDYNIIGIYFSSLVKTADHTNDPLVDKQWYLKKEYFHEAHKDEGVGFGSPEIYTTTFDTGYNQNHEDLPKLTGWFDHVSNSPLPNDLFGHGTAVAGVIMQIPDNKIGGLGVSPGVSFFVRKVLDDNGLGSWDRLAEGIIAQTKLCKTLREENPKVRCTFNFSLLGFGPIPSIDAALDFAYKEGIVAVAAAGNVAVSLDRVALYPAAKKGTIPVAALDEQDRLARFSGYGVNLPVVAAGGINILVTVPKIGLNGTPSGYRNWDGTSFSTPQVVGAINLSWSKYRDLTAEQIKLRILGSVDLIPGLDKFVASGGRLNTLMMLDESSDAPTTPFNFKLTNVSHISISSVHSQIGRVLGYIHFLSEERFDETTTERANVKAIPVLKPNLSDFSTETLRIPFLKENTKYFMARRSFDRFGNASALTPVLEAVTKKAQLFAVRNFTSESGDPDPGQWFPDNGPLVPDLFPVPWHLSNILRVRGRETDFNWRFGRINSLDYFTGMTDGLVKSEIFNLTGLNGASMSFEYFQLLSTVDFGDFFQVFAVPVNEFNKESLENAILLKEYRTTNNSKRFEMEEQFLDLSSVAGRKFRIIFRGFNPSSGFFGGIGWIFGNVKIYTDERTSLY